MEYGRFIEKRIFQKKKSENVLPGRRWNGNDRNNFDHCGTDRIGNDL